MLSLPKEFPGKIDTSTPYIIGKVVSRLEMDSRWALARSVRRSWLNVSRLKKSSKLGNALLQMLPQDQTSGGRAKNRCQCPRFGHRRFLIAGQQWTPIWPTRQDVASGKVTF